MKYNVYLVHDFVGFVRVCVFRNFLSISTEPPRKPSSPRRRTKLEKYRQERAAAQTGAPQGLDVTQDDFFILIEVDELKYQLEVIITFTVSKMIFSIVLQTGTVANC